MFRPLFAALVVASVVCGTPVRAQDRPAAPVESGKLTLPADIVWETDNDEPIIGSPSAIRGGTLNLPLPAYPLTFRLMGPNSNDFYASYNRAFASLPLVGQHPSTDKFIPALATHWSVQKDQKTIYFKLDPDARWSDGKKITASDYVFAWHMMQSKYIVDPAQNDYVKQYIQSVDKIDDYTLRIVGTKPSWRPLYDYNLSPMPEHAIHLDKDWVTRTNNEWLVVPGPYVVTGTERGQSVTFTRIKNWWGDKKRYFIGQYNPDKIVLKIMPVERELDFLRAGDIDMLTELSVPKWHETYNFPAINNGWIHRARVFIDVPSGVNGLQMNMESPVFKDRNFRLAMQYMLDFDKMNRDLWYGDYFRVNSFFQGTPFANPDVKAYPFDPAKAREYLARAGYHRPSDLRANGFWATVRNVLYGLLFTRTGDDDILVNDKGQKASFTVIYYSKNLEEALIVMQQDLRRIGVDMRLQYLEGGAAFQRGLERKYEMFMLRMSSSLYPEPRQYLHSVFKNSKNNNDFWGFGTKEADALIETYEHDLDADKRQKALYRLDQIVHDTAFYIPLRDQPYTQIAYWDYIQWPDFYMPMRGGDQFFADWMVYWIDPAKKAALEQAKKTGKAYPVDKNIDHDYYGVRNKFK